VADALPLRVHRFIAGYIDSIELLEVLLLLASEPHAVFDAGAVSAHLRTTPHAADMRLGQLAARGLAQRCDRGHRLDCTPEVRALLPELARCYRERRVSVVALIYPPRPR